jgi:riboflavin transporter FmnP
MKKTTNRLSNRHVTGIAMLSAIAFVLQFIELPMPLSPSFAKLDFSDLPALIGSFAYGPLAGILIELVKNLLHLLQTKTGGIGEIANFAVGAALVAPAGMIYRIHKTKNQAVIGCVVGSVGMGIVSALMNYYVLLPLYQAFMPMDQIIAMFGQFIPIIQTKLDVVLFNALPMNVAKGLLVSLITVLLYKHLSPILKGNI